MAIGPRRLLCALTLVAAGFHPAAACTLYSFSFSGSGITSSGQLTVSQTAGTYLATAISGMFDGSAITGLITPGGYDGNDNQVFPSGPYLDFGGLSFAVGSKDYNVFYDNGTHGCEVAGYYVDVVGTSLCGPTYDKAVTFSLAAVPEPSGLAWSWLSVGLALGLGLFTRRPLTKR